VEAGCEIEISGSSGGIRVSPSGFLRLEGTSANPIVLRAISGQGPSSFIWSDAASTVQGLYVVGTVFQGPASLTTRGVRLEGGGCNATFQMSLHLEDCSFSGLPYGIAINVPDNGPTVAPIIRNCHYVNCGTGIELTVCEGTASTITIDGGSSSGCVTGISGLGSTAQSMLVRIQNFQARETRLSGSGMTLGPPSELIGCSFVRCFRGLDVGTAQIDNCLFFEDTTAIYTRGTTRCSNSRFSGTVLYDVDCRTPVGVTPTLDFRENNWGPAHTAELDSIGFPANASFIRDWWDDFSFAIVDYSGWQDAATGVPEPPKPRSEPKSWGAVKALFK
jgi:hypothetical protein